MAIVWETDFEAARRKCASAGRPLFQDFWFDG